MAPCRWLTDLAAIVVAATLTAMTGAGCAASGPASAGQVSHPDVWPVSKAAQATLELEQKRLVAVLQRLNATGNAYDRMTEARATIIDAVSWWGTFTVEPASPAVEDEKATSLPAPPAETAPPCTEESPWEELFPRDDPYLELEETPADACSSTPDQP